MERKGKKSNPDKPKQPQRGLGVAELEKIRLNSQMNNSTNYFHTPYHSNLNQGEDIRKQTSSSSVVQSSSVYTSQSYGFQPNMMMGMREKEAKDFRHSDSQYSTTTTRWNHNNDFFETKYSIQPSMTRELFSLSMENSNRKNRRQDRSNSMGSTSQNADSSDTEEIDLDLKLSL